MMQAITFHTNPFYSKTMNKNPLISVLLPLYNEPISLAKQAIDSILNQTFSHLEVILLLDNPQIQS